MRIAIHTKCSANEIDRGIYELGFKTKSGLKKDKRKGPMDGRKIVHYFKHPYLSLKLPRTVSTTAFLPEFYLRGNLQ